MAPSIAFITNPTTRHSAERDPEALARYAGDPRTAIVLLAGDVPVLQGTDPGTSLLPPRVLDRVGEIAGAGLSRHPRRPPGHRGARRARGRGPVRGRCDLHDGGPALHRVAGPRRSGRARPAGQAKSLLSWHARHRFCAHCGAPTTASQAG